MKTACLALLALILGCGACLGDAVTAAGAPAVEVVAGCRNPVTPPVERSKVCNENLKATMDGPTRAEILLLRGSARLDHGEPDLALTDFDDAVQLDAQSALAFNARGVAHYRLGEKVAAIADYDRALELDNNYAVVFFNRANAWLAAGDPVRAERDFASMLELRPEVAAGFAGRGRARYLQGRYWDAYRDLARAHAQEDISDYDRIWIYLTVRRIGGDGRQWLAVEGDDAHSTNWPALVLALLRGEVDAGQAAATASAGDVRNRSRRLSAIHYFAGQRAEILNRPDEAAEQYRAALAAGCASCLEDMASSRALHSLQPERAGARAQRWQGP